MNYINTFAVIIKHSYAYFIFMYVAEKGMYLCKLFTVSTLYIHFVQYKLIMIIQTATQLESFLPYNIIQSPCEFY